ncbi:MULTISPECIES: diacylglycerol/lipid kinase family protein [unclassified Paracoccus (in: a-proteobacteria)]|uniref:diacylglycerol/lipid kinase family protein n=1 Tax=unclassified Paracoccus (in: a-proteobacteria) TaxID=2688777 RepID=UPI0012B18FBC|nr:MULTISPECIES: diacylglycerol kinase family protein [unclassified Paracoccus (in: a-proteobacteria)]UXU75512.1 NAD(+)/NADH kinase [Paracoccus sp. SMMA_5]UXU81417.1 NAD(+)/NADH kinase [Paracoccus sp. SMMA_5_TC]
MSSPVRIDDDAVPQVPGPDAATGQPFDLSRARVCVLVNMGSGRQAGDQIAERLERVLAPRVASLTLRDSGSGADLTGLARQAIAQGCDLIVSVGGDGTQAAVAAAVADSPAAMAVIPGGTFNYFARDLGSGETPDEALRMFEAPRLRLVDVGDMNGMVFLNNVSFGAYPEILKHREDVYRRWGRSRLAAYWSAVAALWNLRRPLRLIVTANGQQRQFVSALVFVAKSAYQLDSFGLEGADRVRAGDLALLIARARRPGPLVRAALRLALGKSARYQDFDLITAPEIRIETLRSRQYVAHDGEKTWMQSPFDCRVRRRALRVLVPAPEPAAAAGMDNGPGTA